MILTTVVCPKRLLVCGCIIAIVARDRTTADAFTVTPLESKSQVKERLHPNSSSKRSPPPSRHNHHGDRRPVSGSRKIHRDNEGGESFALRMMKVHQNDVSNDADDNIHKENNDDREIGQSRRVESTTTDDVVIRRNFLSTMLSTTAAAAISSAPAYAYERSFPDDLDFVDGDMSRDLARAREDRISAQKAKAKKSMDDLSSQPYILRTKKDVLGTVVWSVALWFLAGSRSNPLVTPLANVIYDESEQQWLKDRNDGLFAEPPAPLLFILGAVFLLLGAIADRSILFLAEGDSNVTLQLAGVSLIGGGALELGRIASGEKTQTRDDFDRERQLDDEFAEFASSRLKPGGNCHRSEVVKAFRRYFGKYRVENDQYPLTDLEIERLLRKWNRETGNAEMTSAGFLNGIQIDDQADIFVNR